jgi:hypothetical protein
VIVVVGSPLGRLDDGGAVLAAGSAARIALAAAAAGRAVQLVGRIGDDPVADGVLFDLAGRGVGHVAMLRDAASATPLDIAAVPDPGDVDDASEAGSVGEPRGLALDLPDVDLGLRYLTTFEVVVCVQPATPGLAAVVGEAASWAGARLVLVVEAGATAADGLAPDAIVFEAPASDPDGAFATLVGSFAAALDDGVEPGGALRASIEAEGWTRSGDD